MDLLCAEQIFSINHCEYGYSLCRAETLLSV